jgi:glycerol-3-phosphate dehydrogenase
MRREEMIDRAGEPGTWDVAVVGGGATGLGIAVDAQSRGYRTILLEQGDFAQGASSRSSKLVHGGVRYLGQGNLALVREALRERGRLRANAPHLVRDLAFVVPRYRWWEGPFYGAGLKLYDALAGSLKLSPSRQLSRSQTVASIPGLARENLLGGVQYYDAQFDDARTALALARTAADHGACVLNHIQVAELTKKRGRISGLRAIDVEAGHEIEITARIVVNATGVFADQLRRADDPVAGPIVAPAQGAHVVLPGAFLAGDRAIVVPHTDDGRLLFVVPWQGRVLAGTTDTPVDVPSTEPRPFEEEVRFILDTASRYLARTPRPADVLSAFAGQRPLVNNRHSSRTQDLSREHLVTVSASGLLTVVGGKWTTYRKMAQDAVDRAAEVGALERRACRTENLRLHGWRTDAPAEPWSGLLAYGSDADAVASVIKESADNAKPIHRNLPYPRGLVRFAVREEMARSVEDVLARRTRALVLDARASAEAAPLVGEIAAEELGRDGAWSRQQVTAYQELARGYLP